MPFIIPPLIFILIIVLVLYFLFLNRLVTWARKRRLSNRIARKNYYREYLKSDAWQRKRYVVFKRDNWTCQECGAKATEVHHLKYAKYQIGKEPIDWLVSLCSPCHRKKHN